MSCLTKIITCYPSLFHSGKKSKSAQMFSEVGILKTFAKFTRKHLRWSLFLNKFAGLKFAALQPATLFKKKTQAQVLSCKFLEIFNNVFLTKHLRPTPSTLFLTHAKMLWSHTTHATHELRHPRHTTHPS